MRKQVVATAGSDSKNGFGRHSFESPRSCIISNLKWLMKEPWYHLICDCGEADNWALRNTNQRLSCIFK